MYSFCLHTVKCKKIPFQTIQFSVSTISMSKTVQCQAVQFSVSTLFKYQVIRFTISTQFSSIWHIDRTISGAATLSQRGPGSDDNKGVLRNPPNSSITGTSPSDCLVSYCCIAIHICIQNRHREIQNTYAETQANFLSFRYKRFINFCLQFFDTSRETILKSLS